MTKLSKTEVLVKEKLGQLPKELFEPIVLSYVPEPPLVGATEDVKKMWKRRDADRASIVLSERAKKLELLYGFFDIPKEGPNKTALLLDALLEHLFPGFSLIEAAPRKWNTRWGNDLLGLLWCCIKKRLLKGEDRTIEAACSYLASQPFWKDILSKHGHKKSTELTFIDTLTKKHVDAQKTPLVCFLMNIEDEAGQEILLENIDLMISSFSDSVKSRLDSDYSDRK